MDLQCLCDIKEDSWYCVQCVPESKCKNEISSNKELATNGFLVYILKLKKKKKMKLKKFVLGIARTFLAASLTAWFNWKLF